MFLDKKKEKELWGRQKVRRGDGSPQGGHSVGLIWKCLFFFVCGCGWEGGCAGKSFLSWFQMNLVLTWIWLLEVFGFLVGAFSKKKKDVEWRVWGVCKEGQASAHEKEKKRKKKREASGLWVLPPWLPIKAKAKQHFSPDHWTASFPTGGEMGVIWSAWFLCSSWKSKDGSI